MKAVLEFNLPEEEYEYRDHINGRKFASILNDLDNELRFVIKYDSPSNLTGGRIPSIGEKDMAEKIREFIRERCTENGISLD